jgi:hypothetical protein
MGYLYSSKNSSVPFLGFHKQNEQAIAFTDHLYHITQTQPSESGEIKLFEYLAVVGNSVIETQNQL